jgi:NADH-quinone oxidoreductase subunit H
VWFLAKLMFFIIFYVWLRATLPRLRYDALMALGWKRMLPISLVVLFLVAVIDAARTPEGKMPAVVHTPTHLARGDR